MSQFVCKRPHAAMALGMMLLLSGCRVGPDYHRPSISTPEKWHWQQAAPDDAAQNGLPADPWHVFNDPELDRLETLALEESQTIKIAVARVDEARAFARLSQSALYPQIAFAPAYSRQDGSSSTFVPGVPDSTRLPHIRDPFNTFGVPLELSYEADVWGRVRRSTAAGRERAEASVADCQTIRLAVTSEVAVNYFQLRALDANIAVLQHALELRKKTVVLIEEKFKGGIGDNLAVLRAKSDVSTTAASLADQQRQREQVVHVLAILCGNPASTFALEFKPLAEPPPEIPAGLPSTLLERRPDVVAAERLLAASNEDIGVARANFFPTFSLTAKGAFESVELSKLFNAPSAVFSVASGMFQPIFTGGRNKAQLAVGQGALCGVRGRVPPTDIGGVQGCRRCTGRNPNARRSGKRNRRCNSFSPWSHGAIHVPLSKRTDHLSRCL